MNKKLVLPIFTSFFLLSTILGVHMLGSAFGIEEITEPVYVEIADYYDNRRAVVTVTADDWTANKWQEFEAMGEMLTAKRVYFTGAIITNSANWTQIQYWLDQAYAEAASHSRTHPSTVPYSDYDSEIGGSKQDIIANLVLQPNFMFGSTEYVYTWIEPYGKSDSTIRQKLGYYRYITDRTTRNKSNSWAEWDQANSLFQRYGYSTRMGTDWSGSTDATFLNQYFDTVYQAGGIYHLFFHPSHVDWSPGQYADLHTSYISNRKDVWYVNFGLLYLYHWVDTQDVVQVTSTGSLQDKIFKISISSTDRQNYGAKYPVTYVFDIPPSWTNPYVNYRFRETDAWTTMEIRTSSDFFNGIDAVRFDFSNHKAYVSIGFDDLSNEIYLQILKDVKPDFSATPTSGPEPLTVSFTDTSTSYDRIVSWSWDFGDGQTSTQQNPTHTYTQDGIYTVNLTVYEGDGDSAVKTKEAYITVTDTSPSANFTASQTSGLEPLTVSFTDISTSYDGIMTWEWSFGDGETSTEQNSIHIYASAGLYTVSLTVLEADGDNSDETKSDYIVVGDSVPTASFTYSPPNPLEGDKITFDASGSTGYDEPISYSWDFGDGAIGEGVRPTHTYAQDGDYLVTLTVTDADGSTDSTVHTIAVADKDPMPDFNASPTSEALTVGFTHTSTSYDELVSWAWDFGDGQMSTEQNPTHKFPDDGTFNVSLTVTDADGSTGTITKQVSVLNVAPTADFNIVSSQKPTVDEDIIFIDQSSDPDGPDEIISWFWDLGDGTNSTTQNVTHRYYTLGTFIVNLTVTDDDGATGTISKSITTYDVVPPVTVDDYDGLWHTSDFTIKLSATDDLSGVQTIYYIINDGPVMNVQTHGQPHISVEGHNKLEYWSVDFYENEETHHVIQDIKLDKTSRARAMWIVGGIVLAIGTIAAGTILVRKEKRRVQRQHNETD